MKDAVILTSGKIKKKILKRRLKVKTVTETNPDGSNVRISKYFKIIDKDHIVFILQKDCKCP